MGKELEKYGFWMVPVDLTNHFVLVVIDIVGETWDNMGCDMI